MWSSRVQLIMGLLHGQVKPGTIKWLLIFHSISISFQEKREIFGTLQNIIINTYLAKTP